LAKGLTTGEISAHLAEVYGAEVSRQTISTITDKVMDGMAEWQNRPLDRGRFLSVIANYLSRGSVPQLRRVCGRRGPGGAGHLDGRLLFQDQLPETLDAAVPQ
jgi:hypothetical protein